MKSWQSTDRNCDHINITVLYIIDLELHRSRIVLNVTQLSFLKDLLVPAVNR